MSSFKNTLKTLRKKARAEVADALKDLCDEQAQGVKKAIAYWVKAEASRLEATARGDETAGKDWLAERRVAESILAAQAAVSQAKIRRRLQAVVLWAMEFLIRALAKAVLPV